MLVFKHIKILKSLLLIILMLSKSTWKRVFNLWLALYTPSGNWISRWVWMWEWIMNHGTAKKCGREKSWKSQSPYINCISKKDCYLLLLIYLTHLTKSEYIKIDLCHTYYLFHIADSSEWKTTFKTHLSGL